MQNQAPDQRAIVVRILTSAGFVEGTLRVPRRTCLADAWDHAPDFVPLTDVQLPGLPQRVPFFAIRRHEMLLLVPPADETLIVVPRGQEIDHAMSALLPGQFAIGGTVAVLHDVRLTDHLRRPSTLVLRDATVIGPGVNERHPVVLVDPQRVIGISEQ
jgi:hypothetical protein